MGYGAEGWGFQLSLAAGTERRFTLRGAAGGQVDILSTGGADIASLVEARETWALEAVCARAPDRLDDQNRTEFTLVLDAERLAAAAARSLAEGVSPDSESWARFLTLAAKVLVPATAQSHLMGAGALASDNE